MLEHVTTASSAAVGSLKQYQQYPPPELCQAKGETPPALGQCLPPLHLNTMPSIINTNSRVVHPPETLASSRSWDLVADVLQPPQDHLVRSILVPPPLLKQELYISSQELLNPHQQLEHISTYMMYEHAQYHFSQICYPVVKL